MRLSVKRGDPGFHPDANLLDISVYLNGERVRNCYTAESGENGFVVTAGPPDFGKDGGQVIMQPYEEVTTRGRVEIKENGPDGRSL